MMVPVAMGKVRARNALATAAAGVEGGDDSAGAGGVGAGARCAGLLLHTDGGFSGQGICFEAMQVPQLLTTTFGPATC